VILRSIALRNFRNYQSENFSLHEGLNLIYGENAQGKTNLLEAIHILLTFRSFKQLKTEELIQFGQPQARIKGEVYTELGLNDVHIVLNKGGKAVRLNGKVVYRLTKVVGRFNTVAFLPSDLELIKGSPQGRRRYLDRVICNFNPEHLVDLRSYLRSLMQRNALLTKSARLSSDSIEVWDERIAELGAKIIERRIKYTKKFESEVREIYKLLTGNDSQISMHYGSSFKLSSNISGAFKERLKSSLDVDRRRGYTSVGPHRDLIEFRIDGKNANEFASQGEAKTIAIALKVSEIEISKIKTGRTPILLLDDITSELDERRKSFLFQLLNEFRGQIFVTATNPAEILFKGEKRLFHIKAGSARAADSKKVGSSLN